MVVDVNKYMRNKLLTWTGCVVSLFAFVAFVFYMIYFLGRVFDYDAEWVKIFFLCYGVAAFIIPVPMICKSLFALGCNYNNKCYYDTENSK